MVPNTKFAEMEIDSPKLPGMCSRWIESSVHTHRHTDTLTDTHTRAPWAFTRTEKVVSICAPQPRAVGPKLKTAYECNFQFNLGGMLIVEWRENAGDILNLAAPLPWLKKYQLSICKTFLRWTPYKLLRCNLCTVSSLFNREICPNSDWADFPKAEREGYFLMPFGSSNLSNMFLNYSRPCWGWTAEQSPGSTAERLTELPAGKV